MTFKKGDRVEWNFKSDETHYGTVIGKVKDGFKVIEDGHPDEVWSLLEFRLRPTEHPIPKDSIKTRMDAYEVRKFKKVGTGMDGYIYTGKIFKDGRPILDIVDDGSGGPMLFHRIRRDDDNSLSEFMSALHEWWENLGGKPTSEPENLWIDWQVNERMYGVTGEMYVRKFEEHMAKLLKKET